MVVADKCISQQMQHFVLLQRIELKNVVQFIDEDSHRRLFSLESRECRMEAFLPYAVQ